jgi:hypothetical protein
MPKDFKKLFHELATKDISDEEWSLICELEAAKLEASYQENIVNLLNNEPDWVQDVPLDGTILYK